MNQESEDCNESLKDSCKNVKDIDSLKISRNFCCQFSICGIFCCFGKSKQFKSLNKTKSKWQQSLISSQSIIFKKLNICNYLSVTGKYYIQGLWSRKYKLRNYFWVENRRLHGPILQFRINYLKVAEPLQGDNFLLTTNFPENFVTHLIDLGRIKCWDNHETT